MDHSESDDPNALLQQSQHVSFCVAWGVGLEWQWLLDSATDPAAVGPRHPVQGDISPPEVSCYYFKLFKAYVYQA